VYFKFYPLYWIIHAIDYIHLVAACRTNNNYLNYLTLKISLSEPLGHQGSVTKYLHILQKISEKSYIFTIFLLKASICAKPRFSLSHTYGEKETSMWFVCAF
jgi:hypothetical protein